MLALAYQDNGVFYVRVVDSKGQMVTELNCTEIIGDIDDESKPIHGIY